MKLNIPETSPVLLPGLEDQILFLLNNVDVTDKRILIMGPGSLHIADKLLANGASAIELIIDDEELMLADRLQAKASEKLRIRYMEFFSTDFKDESFDLVYAQASVSTTKHMKILKEIKRITKPQGSICLGELVQLTKEIPASVRNVWERTKVRPHEIIKLQEAYASQGFEPVLETDLSFTMKFVYKKHLYTMNKHLPSMTEAEKKVYKKEIKTYRHEANMYLQFKGDNYTGFIVFLMRKP